MRDNYVWTGSEWKTLKSPSLEQARDEAARRWGTGVQVFSRKRYLQLTENFDVGDAGTQGSWGGRRASRE